MLSPPSSSFSNYQAFEDDDTGPESSTSSVETTTSLPALESAESQLSSVHTLAFPENATSDGSRVPVPTNSSTNNNTHNRQESQYCVDSSNFGESKVKRIPIWLRSKKIQLGTAAAAPPVAVLLLLLLLVTTTTTVLYFSPNNKRHTRVRVAMIGNSMMYYNDMPRLLEALSEDRIQQDSCLHGDASLSTILITGSGTYKIWKQGVGQFQNASTELFDESGKARTSNSKNNNAGYKERLYDYGACTVPQLLFGYDATLDQKMQDWSFENTIDDDDSNEDFYFDDDEYYTMDYANDIYNYNFDSYDDGSNPCLMDPNYYRYRNSLYWQDGLREEDDNDVDDNNYENYWTWKPKPPKWDYIILNDNTRNPAQTSYRSDALSILEQKYIAWFQETGATPVLMFTYAYDTPYRDMSGLLDIPTFTSLTYEGYRQFAELLSQRLPENQQPKIAPVGLAFLTVWEESFDFWNSTLFHVDRIHPSPHGTFLQGCVVYCTLYGLLPPKTTAIGKLETLFDGARRMQPSRHRRLPLPTREEASYLYHVAERVCLQNHVPKSFVHYENGESTDYTSQDDTYKNDNIY